MSIQPIDLQVLFSRLNQIGRDQALQRDSVLQAQAVAASEIAERSEEKDRRVSHLSTEQEGPESLDDETGGPGGGGRERHQPSAGEGEAGPDVFSDPDLGQNVDLTG